MKKIYFLLIFFFAFSSWQGFAQEATGQRLSLSQVFDVDGWEYISSADLKSKYTTLWAISDIHGELDRLVALLLKAGLVREDRSRNLLWSPAAKGQLLIIAGDLINKGNDSVGVLRLLLGLQKQAKEQESRIVILLGNNEAEFLANRESKETHELETSAESPENLAWLERGKGHVGKEVTPKELREESSFGRNLREFKVGLVVGQWLFAHSGGISAGDDIGSLTEWVKTVGELQKEGRVHGKHQQFDKAENKYKKLVEDNSEYSSLICERDWTTKEKWIQDVKAKIDLLGIKAVLVGHDPGALKHLGDEAYGSIAIHHDGWLVKLDSGMNPEANYSTGRLLKCEVHKILEKSGMELMNGNKSNCVQVDRENSGLPIPVL